MSHPNCWRNELIEGCSRGSEMIRSAVKNELTIVIRFYIFAVITVVVCIMLWICILRKVRSVCLELTFLDSTTYNKGFQTNCYSSGIVTLYTTPSATSEALRGLLCSQCGCTVGWTSRGPNAMSTWLTGFFSEYQAIKKLIEWKHSEKICVHCTPKWWHTTGVLVDRCDVHTWFSKH